jgi:hypothetical protein
VKHWTPEDRIDGRTLGEHVTKLYADLGLNPRQRALLVEELRSVLWNALLNIDLGNPGALRAAEKSIERVLALADALTINGRQTHHLGLPTRTNAIRTILRERGEAWTSFPELATLALPHCAPGTASKDLNDSFRTMLATGEVEHDGGERGRRRYRLASTE